MLKSGRQERLLLLTLACLIAAAFFLFSPAARAQENFGLTEGQNFGSVALPQTSDLKGTIARVINIALGFLGIVAVILILYAGFLWMTARGNEEQVKRAKDLLRNALIGLAIILSAWGIAAFVISRLSGTTGGGDGGGGGGGGGGIGGGLPAERFTLQEFQTLHAGKTNRDDVFRCSNVQTRFNHWLDIKSLAAARTALKASQVGTITYRGEVEPVTPSTLSVDVDARGNSLRFERRDNNNPQTRINWPPFAQIELQVPKAVTDTAGKTIADCTALGCNDRGAYYAWLFTTTDKKDETKPLVSSAYPRLSGTLEGYPDRNVDRSLTFAVNFSKAVDFFSVVRADGRLVPENVKVEQIVSDKDAKVVAAIATEHFDASLSATGFQFALNKSHQSSLLDGPYLEPYTWYRITLKNIVDLCGNQLAGETSWIFQTNGNVPGVAFTYPSDGYQFACPATETFVQFRTSMYDVKTSSCAVNPNGGGLVQAGSGLPGRQLRVTDNVPAPGEGSAPVNPNEFCKRYDFTPATKELAANTQYSAQVDYRNPANDAQENQAKWSFAVKPADGCANAPYISNLSPVAGPWGRCLTVQGNYFGAVAGRQSFDNAYTKVALDSPRNLLGSDPASQRIRGNWTRAFNDGNGMSFNIKNEQWADSYLTGEVPNIKAYQDSQETVAPVSLLPATKDGILDLDMFVARQITLGGKAEKLSSNTVRFSVPLDARPYQGPCLYTINPTEGKWGSKVNLTGTNFLPAKDSAVGDIIFTNNVKTAAGKWENNLLTDATVPSGSISGEVKVQTKQGVSNGIKFNITAERGGQCVPNTGCGANQTCSERGICEDVPQPSGFSIVEAWPSAACASTCKNAEVGLRASGSLVPASLVPAVFGADGKRISGGLSVRKCVKDDCRDLEAGNLAFTTALSEDNKRLVLKWPLAANASYRVFVYGGESGVRTTDPSNSILANANYQDAYSWYFKVSGNDCSVDRVRLDKTSIDLYEKESGALLARAYARPDQCSPQDGQVLNVAQNFNWKSCAYPADGNLAAACRPDCPAIPQIGGKNIFALQTEADKSRGAYNVVTGMAGEKSGSRGLACVGYGGTFSHQAAVIVRPLCNSDADCALGGSCPGSICNLDKTSPNFGRCSPIIKSVTPADGRSGTWVNINGCYFGNSRGVAKYNAIPFLEPALCGNSWNNSQIVAEAPPLPTGTVGGPGNVTVETVSKMAVTRPNGFTINDNTHPGLCRLEPEYGPAGGSVRLMGKNFGVKSASDQVYFSDKIAMADSRNWSDTNITVTTPALTASETPVRVKVVKGANPSGELNFRVTAGGTVTGPGVVTPEDIKVAAFWPGHGKNACPAQVIEVLFSGAIDSGSVTQNTFLVRDDTAKKQLDGTVILTEVGGSETRLSFIPKEDLPLSHVYQIILKGGDAGLRSATGGKLVADATFCQSFSPTGECVIPFQTMAADSAELISCQAQSLAIEPANPIYTCAGANDCPGDKDGKTSGRQDSFYARTLSRAGQPIVVKNGYDWETRDSSILGFANEADKSGPVVYFTVQPKNGSSLVSAKPKGTTVAGSTEARVFLCKNPWPPLGSNNRFTPFSDSEEIKSTAAGPRTNFSTFYCRDRSLPLILLQLEIDKDDKTYNVYKQGKLTNDKPQQDVPGLLKELFFTVPRSGTQTTDAIGIRVLQNPDGQRAGDWYRTQGFSGNPQPSKVDDYEAVQDGRTVYVSAPNDSDGDDGAAGAIYNNIYLVSMSDQVQAETQDIWNQLINNWRFAVNVKEAAKRAGLRRDVKRWFDLSQIISLLSRRASPPSLESGSFEKNVSTSVWPSWQQTLGAELGASLPTDPLNTVDASACAAAGASKDTCWLPNDKKFKCLATNSVYYYKWLAGGKYSLQARLEYQGQSWAKIKETGSGWTFITGDACGNLGYNRP